MKGEEIMKFLKMLANGLKAFGRWFLSLFETQSAKRAKLRQAFLDVDTRTPPQEVTLDIWTATSFYLVSNVRTVYTLGPLNDCVLKYDGFQYVYRGLSDGKSIVVGIGVGTLRTYIIKRKVLVKSFVL